MSWASVTECVIPKRVLGNQRCVRGDAPPHPCPSVKTFPIEFRFRTKWAELASTIEFVPELAELRSANSVRCLSVRY